MAQQNVVALEKVLKYNHIFDRVAKQVFTTTFALTNLMREAGTVKRGGRHMLFSLKTAMNPSFRGMLGSERVAGPGVPKWEEVELTMAKVSSQMEFDIEGEEASATDRDAFVESATELMTDTMEGFRYKSSISFWNDSTGAVARVKTVVGNVATLYDEGETGGKGFGTRYLFQGGEMSASANLVGYDAERSFSGIVTAIDGPNIQVTFTNASDLTANDYLFWGSKTETSKNRMPNGFPEAVDDGVEYASWHGLNRNTAGNAYWQGNVERTWGTQNLESGFQTRMIEVAERTKGGASTDVILYDLRTEQLYFNQLKVNRQALMPVESIKGVTLTGGFQALGMVFNKRSVPCIGDVECPKGIAWGLDWSSFFLGYRTMPRWLDKGEGVFKWINQFLAYCAIFYATWNLGNKRPMSQWAIKGIG
jgi:hypothetical protein